jgi:hypothetical protein
MMRPVQSCGPTWRLLFCRAVRYLRCCRVAHGHQVFSASADSRPQCGGSAGLTGFECLLT